MLYKCKILDESGNVVLRTIEAGSESEVIDKFKNDVIIEISPIKEKSEYKGKILKKIELQRLFSQLSSLLYSGIPILGAFRIIEEESENKKIKKIANLISIELQKGETLSRALGKFKFSRFYITTIKVGEETGRLPEILNELSEHLQEEIDMRRKIKSSLIYPFIVILGIIGVLYLFIFYVFPRFEIFYKSINAELPLITKIVFGIPKILKKWTLLPIFVAVFLYFISRFYIIKKFFDKIRFKIPIFGPLYRKINIYFFSQYLKILIESGVGIISSINIVKEVVDSINIREALEKTDRFLRSGNPLSISLKNSPFFSLNVVNIIKIGEETGSLEKSLGDITKFYGKEIETTLNNLTTILEPFIIIILGFFVGIIALSLYLPIFNLIKAIR
jgi:type IV pilus assembly protein PilC